MLRWLSSRWTAPTPADVDIVPCCSLDLTSRAVIITFSFVFHAQLDVDILRQALFQAVEHKIPRAGARLVYRNGQYEWHIPKQFSAERPPARFTHAQLDAPLSAFNFPPSGGDMTQPCVADGNHEHLFKDSNVPKSLSDLLLPGTPALHVHVCTLPDATLIGVTSTHALMDAHGMRALLVAWTAAVNGSLDAVPAMPRTFDPLADIAVATTPTSRPVGEPMRFFPHSNLFTKIRFFVSYIWMAFHVGEERRKLVRFPKTWLAEQKRLCMDELSIRGTKEYVGTVDVLLAWLYKTVYTHRKDATLVRIKTVVNVRRLLPTFFAQPYLNNAATWTEASLPASVIASQPVLETALAIRRSIDSYVSPSSVSTLQQEMAWSAQFAGVGLKLMLPYLPGEEMLIASSWRSAGLQEVDFLGAAGGKSAKAVFAFPSLSEKGWLSMEGVGTLCCETDDAMWLSFTLREDAWTRIPRDGGLAFA
ncbi:hypothetical protein EXIGLDRAFT_836856 [Exidia glandulosa HHB12029]|uniref:Transferase-domain-containing protein n=1 Tax=Exidia glandulosa HHB12029 TaxID=1314781 RepID=A0A165HD21_EXIGL|nr:hypothetical protein EXIGLDRAFT_836856 [Exidia glandulosa HHB12029]